MRTGGAIPDSSSATAAESRPRYLLDRQSTRSPPARFLSPASPPTTPPPCAGARLQQNESQGLAHVVPNIDNPDGHDIWTTNQGGTPGVSLGP